MILKQNSNLFNKSFYPLKWIGVCKRTGRQRLWFRQIVDKKKPSICPSKLWSFLGRRIPWMENFAQLGTFKNDYSIETQYLDSMLAPFKICLKKSLPPSLFVKDVIRDTHVKTFLSLTHFGWTLVKDTIYLHTHTGYVFSKYFPEVLVFHESNITMKTCLSEKMNAIWPIEKVLEAFKKKVDSRKIMFHKVKIFKNFEITRWKQKLTCSLRFL